MKLEYYKKYEPIFGSWYIKKLLGSGSFGRVFEIVREEYGEIYRAALKFITIPPNEEEWESVKRTEGFTDVEVATYFRDMVADFTNEFALMSKLKGNSNIVSYEDHQIIEHEDGRGWDILIRMELLTSLYDYIGNNTINEDEVARIGKDICKALSLCERHKIIHRDIKPENIFISEAGDFKLGDFGVARIAEQSIGASTKVGTPEYMAPEIIIRSSNYDNRVDIYSLGMVMYKLLNANRIPFVPLPPNPLTFDDRKRAEERRLNGETPPKPYKASDSIARVILRACAFDPDGRYPTPMDMYYDLTGEKPYVPHPQEDWDTSTRLITEGTVSGSYTIPPSKHDVENHKDKTTSEVGKRLTNKSNNKLIVASVIVGMIVAFLAAGLFMRSPSSDFEKTSEDSSEPTTLVVPKPKEENVGAQLQTTDDMDTPDTVENGVYDAGSFSGSISEKDDSEIVLNEDMNLGVQSNVILVGDSIEYLLMGKSSYIPNENADIQWGSDNKDIAVVENGVVTGQSTGIVTISAKYRDIDRTSTLKVTNIDAGAGAKVTADYDNLSVQLGSSSLVNLTFSGNLPDKVGASCYSSKGLLSYKWGELDERSLPLTIETGWANRGDCDVTVLVYPDDDPQHIVAATKIHLRID